MTADCRRADISGLAADTGYPAMGPSMPDAEAQADMAREQLRLTTEALIRGGWVHLALAGIVLALLWDNHPSGLLGSWGAALALAVAIRIAASAWYLYRSSRDIRLGRNLLLGTGVVTGIVWGLLPVLFFGGASLPQQTLITFVLGGVCLGALPITAYYPPSFFALFLPALTPLVVMHFLAGGEMYLGMGAMLVVFWTALLLFGRRFGDTLGRLIRLQATHSRLLSRLNEAQETLEAALESRRDSFAIFDADDRLVLWNDVFAKRFQTRTPPLRPGTSFEDIIAAGAWRRRDPVTGEPDHAWARRRIEHHCNPGDAFEEKVGRLWLLVQEFKTRSNHTVIVHTDISDLKEREHALRDSEAQKAGIVSAALDGVITVDANAVVQEYNEAAAAIFGWPRAKVLGRSVRKTLLAPQCRNEFAEQLDAFLANGTSPLVGRRTEMAARRRDGRDCPIELSVVQVATAQGTQLTAFVRDISDRLEGARRLTLARDEAEAASRAKSIFLATIGHEIRTPMNGVLGALELLMDTPLAEDQRCMASTALGAGEVLRGLLDDLLDYSRIEAGRLELAQVVFSPRAVMSSGIDIFTRQADEKGLALHAEADPDVPEAVIGDPVRLRQILLNLIGNALKFTLEGSVRVRLLRVGETETGRTILRISVIDTGIGVPETFRDKLFAKFTQADPTAVRGAGGAGLGLAIVKGLTELMDGSVGCTSSEGGGSHFWCDLPVDCADAAALPPQPDEIGRDRADLTGLRILLVDDSEINRRVTREMLSRAGAAVFEADSGPDALEQAGKRPWNLIVMDISMPGMDGMDAFRALQEMLFPPPPVIALTAHAGEEDRRRFLALGFAGYLPKPIRRSQLLGLVAEVTGLGDVREHATAETATADDAAIDTAVLDALRTDVGETGFARLVRRFLEESDERRRAMEEAIAAGDRDRLELHAHALKSAARSFGAVTFARQAEALERQAGTASDETLKKGYAGLAAAHDAARADIERHCAAPAFPENE